LSNKIMLVDADEENIKAVSQAVKGSKYQIVDIADTFATAAVRYFQHEPDLILVSVNLHHNDSGLEFAEKIREGHDTPILFIADSNDHKAIRKAVMTSPFGYISSPVDQDELILGIDLALKRNQEIMKRKRSQIELLNRAQSQETSILVRGIFHDLMNPLAVIKLGLARYKKDGVADFYDQLVTRVEDMISIIEGARSQIKYHVEESEEYFLKPIINQAIELMDSHLKEADVHVLVEGDHVY